MTDDNSRPKVKVKRSSAGLGLFAEENIAKDQTIVEYLGDRITEEEANRRGGRYLFEVTKDLFIDGKGRENLARYVNHACNPNTDSVHHEDEDRIYFEARKNIAAGEEITIDYGKEYLEEIIGLGNCRCTKCLAA